jgi:YfiH family protein
VPAGLLAAVDCLTSERTHGDLAAGVDPAVREARRRALVDLPWAEVAQVHGAAVVEVGGGRRPSLADTEADALVTAEPGVVLAVRTADCAPVIFAADNGALGVAHAGWPGTGAGVVEATVAALRRLGAGRIEARIGPSIEGACYEFGAAELARFVDRYGPVVRCMTRWGTPALSLHAAIGVACRRQGVELVGDPPPCTACAADRYWSHRARSEPGRMVSAVWRWRG